MSRTKLFGKARSIRLEKEDDPLFDALAKKRDMSDSELARELIHTILQNS